MPVFDTVLRRFRRIDPMKPDALIIDLDGVAVDDEGLAFQMVSSTGHARHQDGEQQQDGDGFHTPVFRLPLLILLSAGTGGPRLHLGNRNIARG